MSESGELNNGATYTAQPEFYSSSKNYRHLYSLTSKNGLIDYGIDPDYGSVVLNDKRNILDYQNIKTDFNYGDFIKKITPFVPLLNCIPMQPLPLYTNFIDQSEFCINFDKYIDIMYHCINEDDTKCKKCRSGNKPSKIQQPSCTTIVCEIITCDSFKFVGFNKTYPIRPMYTHLYRYMYTKTIDNISKIVTVKNSILFNSKEELNKIEKIMLTEDNIQPIYYGSNDFCHKYIKHYDFNDSSILTRDYITNNTQLYNIFKALTRSENYYYFYNDPTFDNMLYENIKLINNIKGENVTIDSAIWLYRAIKNVVNIKDTYTNIQQFETTLGKIIDDEIMLITEVEKALIIQLAYYLYVEGKLTIQKNIDYITILISRIQTNRGDISNICLYVYSE